LVWFEQVCESILLLLLQEIGWLKRRVNYVLALNFDMPVLLCPGIRIKFEVGQANFLVLKVKGVCTNKNLCLTPHGKHQMIWVLFTMI
jgi:hypothetical protein